MALAIDSSTPARFTGTTDVSGNFTTGTFNTPTNCLVLVTVGMHGPPSSNVTITLSNNGAATIWATIGEAGLSATGNKGLAAAYYTYLSAARTGMTVTLATSAGASAYTAVKIYNITGAASSSSIGGSMIAGATSSPVTTSGFTIAANNSFGFLVCLNDAGSAATSSTDTTFDNFANFGDVSGGSGYKSLGAAGGSATFNITGGSTAVWNYVTFEVKASSGGGGVPPTPAIPTFVNGTVYHASDLNALGSNVTNLYNYTMSGFRTYKPITVVRILKAFTVSTATYTTVQFDTPDINTDGMFDSLIVGFGNLYLVVRTAGVYRLYLQYNQAPGTPITGNGETHICINGVVVSSNSVAGTEIGGRSTNCQATVGLSAGDHIYAVVWQNTGADQNSSATYGGSYLAAEWLSP